MIIAKNSKETPLYSFREKMEGRENTRDEIIEHINEYFSQKMEELIRIISSIENDEMIRKISFFLFSEDLYLIDNKIGPITQEIKDLILQSFRKVLEESTHNEYRKRMPSSESEDSQNLIDSLLGILDQEDIEEKKQIHLEEYVIQKGNEVQQLAASLEDKALRGEVFLDLVEKDLEAIVAVLGPIQEITMNEIYALLDRIVEEVIVLFNQKKSHMQDSSYSMNVLEENMPPPAIKMDNDQSFHSVDLEFEPITNSHDTQITHLLDRLKIHANNDDRLTLSEDSLKGLLDELEKVIEEKKKVIDTKKIITSLENVRYLLGESKSRIINDFLARITLDMKELPPINVETDAQFLERISSEIKNFSNMKIFFIALEKHTIEEELVLINSKEFLKDFLFMLSKISKEKLQEAIFRVPIEIQLQSKGEITRIIQHSQGINGEAIIKLGVTDDLHIAENIEDLFQYLGSDEIKKTMRRRDSIRIARLQERKDFDKFSLERPPIQEGMVASLLNNLKIENKKISFHAESSPLLTAPNMARVLRNVNFRSEILGIYKAKHLFNILALMYRGKKEELHPESAAASFIHNPSWDDEKIQLITPYFQKRNEWLWYPEIDTVTKKFMKICWSNRLRGNSFLEYVEKKLLF